ncbi:MAG: adenosine kinase [Bdellovibrionales bacterium]
MKKLIGMGAAIVDKVKSVDEGFLTQHNFKKGDMHLIDADQAQGLTASLSDAVAVAGGSAANTTVGYALFGGRAMFAGRVANDDLGNAYAQSMEDAGVRFVNLQGTQDIGTGYCCSMVTPDGERTMATYLGASGDFTGTSVTPALLDGADMLFLEGYIWDTPARAEAADKAIRAIHAAGGKVGFTLSDVWVVKKHHGTFMQYLKAGMVDVLFANKKEIKALAGIDDFDKAIEATRHLAKTVVVTRSEEGAMILQGDTTYTVPAVKIDRVVDATGAGDMFAAGFLFGHLNGYSPEESGRIAAAAAAHVISHIGARPKQDLKLFL